VQKTAVSTAVMAAASGLGSHLAGNVAVAARRKIGHGLIGGFGREAFIHGLAGKTQRKVSSALFSSFYGHPTLQSYDAIRAMGAHLSKLPPSERVHLVHRLRTDLEKSKYLKDAPITGDLRDVLSKVKDHELLHPEAAAGVFGSSMHKLPKAGIVPVSEDKAVRAMSRVFTAGRLGAGAAGAPTVLAADVGRFLRLAARSGSHEGAMTTSFVRGIAGRKTPVVSLRSGHELSASRVGQYGLGTFDAEVRDMGFAFRKELEHNPVVAKRVYEDVVDLALGPQGGLKGHLSRRGIKLISPKMWRAVGEAAAENPRILSDLQSTRSAPLLTAKLTAVRMRSGLGMTADTKFPTIGQIMRSMINKVKGE